MRNDPLQQYASARRQLLAEKASLLKRLDTINQALEAGATSPGRRAAARSAGTPTASKSAQPEELLTQREAITRALREHGPLTRQELAKAIQEMGYVSKAKDPLNSMGIVLYAKNTPIQKKDGKFFLPARAKISRA